MKKIISVLLFCMFLISQGMVSAWAKGASSTAAAFLKIGASGRAVGMGEAFCGVADGVDAIYWNPGGLAHPGGQAQVWGNQVSFMHSEWLEEVRNEYAGYVRNIEGIGTIGGAFSYLSYGEIEEVTSENNKPVITGETFTAGDLAISLTYGREFGENFGIGGNIKYVRQKIANSEGNGLGFDVGIAYIPPIENLTLGLALRNVGPKMEFETARYFLPVNIKSGFAYKLLGDNLTLAVDLNYYPIEQGFNACSGMEYRLFNELVALRLGYKYDSLVKELGGLSGMTVGIGFFYEFIGVDYAWVPYGELSKKLGGTHRLSLVGKF